MAGGELGAIFVNHEKTGLVRVIIFYFGVHEQAVKHNQGVGVK